MSAPAVQHPHPPSMARPLSPTRSGRTSPSPYHLDVRQQPRQARMAGTGEKADRRPIDPPPIVRLRVRRPSARKKPAHLLTDADLSTPTLTHTLFMFASLVEEDSEEEMFEVHGSKSALVAGSVVSSLFHLRDQSCFVFPDMSVRMEGRWRFKMSLYEVNEEGVEFCTSILTDVFQVYSSKRFPGMGKSTELSKSVAQQGLKLRIRRPAATMNDTPEGTPAPAPRLAQKFPTLRRAPNIAAPPSGSFAAPPPRRPSEPAATTPAEAVGESPLAPGKRLWTSWDAAIGGDALPGHSHELRHSHSRAYGSYPPHAMPHGSPSALAQTRPLVYDDYPHTQYRPLLSLSGPQRSTPSSHRHSVHPYAAALGPLPGTTAQGQAYARPGVQAHAHMLPPPVRPLAPPHSHLPPHAHADAARRVPSPPPVLAPLRHLPPASPGRGARVARSPPTATPASFLHHATPGGTAPAPPVHAHARQTHAVESSVRSTDSDPPRGGERDERGHGRGAGGPGGPSSLARLLGGERDAKEVEGGEGGVVFL
ncbi:hypothetical protein JCM3770_005603 [Rhodotorula araucariae]